MGLESLIAGMMTDKQICLFERTRKSRDYSPIEILCRSAETEHGCVHCARRDHVRRHYHDG